MPRRREIVHGAAAAMALLPTGMLSPLAWGATTSRTNFIDTTAVRARVSAGLKVPVAGVHVEYLWLRMPDGIKLAGSLYLPAKHNGNLPGIFKTGPYRKDDDNFAQVVGQNGFFAQNGYAALRVDVRGTGSSQGVALDEYTAQEHDDSVHIIDWMSRQPWCNGRIGMYGKSYEGFNTIQVAMRQPPALKAIVPGYATDDRYTDDVHYLGGALQVLENSWAINMMTSNAMPAPPHYDPRSESAAARFNTEPWIFRWLEKQSDSAYWRHGSLRPDYGRIQVPTLSVTGWLDGYPNFASRIARYVDAPTKTLIGPWLHQWPWEAAPGPRIDGMRTHVLRWFDFWLKGIQNGVMEEPSITAFMPRWSRQGYNFSDDIPGDWLHLNTFSEDFFEPSARYYLTPDEHRQVETVEQSTEALGSAGTLSGGSGPASALKLRYRAAVGVRVKSFAPTGSDGVWGMDQRLDDALGLTFDTPPMRDDLRIMGFPRARLFVASSAPISHWVVRVCDVAPDGRSTWVSRGVLNGVYRKSFDKPELLTPGEIYELDIELYSTAWTFERGHRLRVVVSNGDWPHIWPSPYPALTTLYTGGKRASFIELPIFTGEGLPGPALIPGSSWDFDTGVTTEPTGLTEGGYSATHDLHTGDHRIHFAYDRSSRTVLPDGTRLTATRDLNARVNDANPADASMAVNGNWSIEKNGRTVTAVSDGTLSSTKDHFELIITSSLVENNEVVHERVWRKKVARKGA